MPASVTDLLRQADVFARLPEPILRSVGSLLHERRFKADQVLFRQGEPTDSLYLVLAGRVRISVTDANGREKVLAFSGVGDLVGELSLLSGEARSATALASTDVKALQLRKTDFDALLANNLDLMRELARVVSRRHEANQQRAFEETGERTERPLGIVTAVCAPRGGAGVTTIATNLAVALAHRAPDRVVLVDLHGLFGHVPVMLNLSPRTSLSAISLVALRQMDRESLDFYLTTHPESSLRVLPAALQPEEAEVVTGEHVSTVLDLLRRQFQYVILDVARGFSEVSLAAIERAANILMVCTPDRAGVRGVAECQRIFSDVLHVPPSALQYLLNHPVPHALLSADQLQQSLQIRLVDAIPFGGDVPTRAALEGHPIVTRWPHSSVGKSLLNIAARLQQQAAEVAVLAGL